MSSSSITSRFIASVFSNIIRGGLSVITALAIARGLGPESYGDFIFLLGTFMALRQLLGMGSDHAFYTFMSQKPRGKIFVASYAAWQLVQFILPLLAIGLLFPQEWIERIWVGKDRLLILSAFAAVFMRQNAWQMMVYIGESSRLTYRVQTLNLFLALIHFLLVMAIWRINLLSVQFLFGLIVVEYLAALMVAYRVLFVHKLEDQPFDGKAVWHEYRVYCVPLILYSLLGFAHEFADRWLLQDFAGSKEQGFYGIGYHFSAVSLLATISLLRIFWKEVAEGLEANNLERIHMLFRKISRFLFTAGAIFSGFLIPWSDDIVRLALGDSYSGGGPVLAVMLLFPIYQSLGQVTGTMLLAGGKTKARLLLGSIFMGISIPIAYLTQAPADAWIPGFELGAIGMAWKMALLTAVSSNGLVWWISREYGWEFDWLYQVVAMAGALLLGWLSFEIVTLASPVFVMNLPVKGGAAFILYAIMMGIFIWSVPWVAGMTRQEIASQLRGWIHVFKGLNTDNTR